MKYVLLEKYVNYEKDLYLKNCNTCLLFFSGVASNLYAFLEAVGISFVKLLIMRYGSKRELASPPRVWRQNYCPPCPSQWSTTLFTAISHLG